ncbi:SDR family oxidoreductase [Baaleninema simplex]|uniref:SDR family oxidoreductase n=1 Tax=Baaleninema simplex TaxID=2862350 RepID=UPI00034AD04E|nr:SDR family oxidoreductase [Baaleninema simplex]
MNQQKHIVLTGVTRGLGRAMLEGFVEAGHVVYGCARDEEAIASLNQQFGRPHHFASVNVTDDDSVRQWSEAVLSQRSAPDLLVNNAGFINEPANLWEVPAAEFDRVVDVNLKGVANLLRHFVPAMVRRGEGVIVNFSSTWGHTTSPQVAPYCATKWGIEGLTRSLSQELPSGLAAIALNPGVIHTDMLETCFGSSAKNYMSPETWGKAAVPLLLGLTAADNGASLRVSA